MALPSCPSLRLNVSLLRALCRWFSHFAVVLLLHFLLRGECVVLSNVFSPWQEIHRKSPAGMGNRHLSLLCSPMFLLSLPLPHPFALLSFLFCCILFSSSSYLCSLSLFFVLFACFCLSSCSEFEAARSAYDDSRHKKQQLEDEVRDLEHVITTDFGSQSEKKKMKHLLPFIHRAVLPTTPSFISHAFIHRCFYSLCFHHFVSSLFSLLAFGRPSSFSLLLSVPSLPLPLLFFLFHLCLGVSLSRSFPEFSQEVPFRFHREACTFSSSSSCSSCISSSSFPFLCLSPEISVYVFPPLVGPDGYFYELYKKPFQIQQKQYTYEVSPFGDATQREGSSSTRFISP